MESGNLLTENEQRLRSMRKVNTDNKLGENIRKIVVTYPNHEPAFIAIDQVSDCDHFIMYTILSMLYVYFIYYVYTIYTSNMYRNIIIFECMHLSYK